MSTIHIDKFDGLAPRVSPTLLNEHNATDARNVKLQSGEIRAWRKPLAIAPTVQHGVTTIYKMEGVGGMSLWCEWTDDTDVCSGPLPDATDSRIYYSENGVCKKTTYALATDGNSGAYPRNWLYMGLPIPANAPSLRVVLDPDTSSENTEARAYLYTYVSEFDGIEEESAPSDPTRVVCSVTGATVFVSGFSNPPTSHYNVTAIRIYRTLTSDASAVYSLVDELPLVDHRFPSSGTSVNGVAWSDGEYGDTRTALQLGKELDTLNADPPPEGLRGLVSMPNGFLAGFINNQVWFSEPFKPYAWPMDYMLTVDTQIVGLGVYGTTLVVCTVSQPYTISGTHPSSMTQEKLPMVQPCVSKSSIAYDQYGVLYASSYGVVAIAGGQMDVFSRPLMSADDWATYNPATMRGAMYDNQYFIGYMRGDEDGVLVFARADTPALIALDFKMSASFLERGTGKLYFLNGDDDTIYQMDADPINLVPYTWQSKRFVNPYWTGFSAMKLDVYFYDNAQIDAYNRERAEIIVHNNQVLSTHENSTIEGGLNDSTANTFVLNGSLLMDLPVLAEYRYVTVTLKADGNVVYERSFTDYFACRIPPIRSFDWQVRITGTANVRSFTMATTMRELSAPN
jgi:hypothetical protein